MKVFRFSKVLIVLSLLGAQAGAQSVSSNAGVDKNIVHALLSAKIEAGEYGAVSSLWIEKDGEVLFYEHFRDTNEASYHNMRSVGKTVTGMLLGAAIDDGVVHSTNIKAADYFKNLQPFEKPDPRKSNITLEHLLTMSGPLECDDFNSFSRGNEERMYVVEDWSAFFWKLPIKNRPSWEIPEDDGGFDRLFSYCTAGSQLIGEIVERATGQTAPVYAQHRLFGRIGIEKPKWNYASTGKAHLGGGLELTTTDWAKLGRLMVDEGQFDGKQVLSKKWVEASFKNYVHASSGTGYGYFFWRPDYTVRNQTYTANMMSGTGANRIYILPEFKTVVVITKNNYQDREAHTTSDALFEKEIIPLLSR